MKRVIITGLALLVWAGVVWAQQQRAERGTAQWQIPVQNYNAGWTVTVHVIDTTGVCLYIVRDTTGQHENISAITAMSKLQLPPGAGCQ